MFAPIHLHRKSEKGMRAETFERGAQRPQRINSHRGAIAMLSLSRLPYPAHAHSPSPRAPCTAECPSCLHHYQHKKDEQCHQIVFTSMPCITGCDAVKEHLPVNDLFNLSCRLRIRLTCITSSAHVNTPAQCAVGASSATHPEVGDFQSPQSFAQQQIP